MKTILVVDDEKTLRVNLCEMLTFEGFKAIEAENGAVAIRLARFQPPDMIICDVAMPEMDGFEVLAAAKGRCATAAMPVILLTAQRRKILDTIRFGDRGRLTMSSSRLYFSDVLAKVRACLGQ